MDLLNSVTPPDAQPCFKFLMTGTFSFHCCMSDLIKNFRDLLTEKLVMPCFYFKVKLYHKVDLRKFSYFSWWRQTLFRTCLLLFYWEQAGKVAALLLSQSVCLVSKLVCIHYTWYIVKAQ